MKKGWGTGGTPAPPDLQKYGYVITKVVSCRKRKGGGAQAAGRTIEMLSECLEYTSANKKMTTPVCRDPDRSAGP